MKKRILSILLLCCMVLTLLPTAAFAAGELPDVKLSVPTTFDKTVDLTEQNGELKIKDSKTYLIKGSTDPNWYFQYRIKIDGKNNTPHIFLDGVRLQAPKDGPAIELYGGAIVGLCTMPKSLRDELHISEDDVDSISGFARSIEGVEIGIMIREVEDGGGKISLRTSEHYNASELCKALGGGGHAAAAGATVPGGIAGARHAILSLLAQRGIIRER